MARLTRVLDDLRRWLWLLRRSIGGRVKLQIFGDNILECERALRHIGAAVGASRNEVVRKAGPLYAPRFEISVRGLPLLEAQLFPGYGRWGFDVRDEFSRRGALLREASDAVVVRAPNDGSDNPELLFVVEYSSALPAGNNAWQRCGRALSAGLAGIPFLYVTDVGGVELDADRNVKAARLPNPLVPFAYLAMGKTIEQVASPVFERSPTATPEVQQLFETAFDNGEGNALIRRLVYGEDPTGAVEQLRLKALRAVQVLAGGRRRNDSLNANEWADLYAEPNGRAIAERLIARRLPWDKRASIASLTPTFRTLVDLAVSSGAVAAGSSNVPICLLEPSNRSVFSQRVAGLYGGRLARSMADWLGGDSKPLVITWIAGFKPGGDDSRPDRGLVAMSRMLFGDDVDYLAVVYGPAKPAQWIVLDTNPEVLAESNGLWEAILRVNDAVLVDSSTAASLKTIAFQTGRLKAPVAAPRAPLRDIPILGEHDVDSVLHALFADAESFGVYECMCNPPGGDWSGLRYREARGGRVYRWSSLPRVTAVGSKRPDHVVSFLGTSRILSLESKEAPSSLESGIGPRLSSYVAGLLAYVPNNASATGYDREWEPYTGNAPTLPAIFSGGAVVYAPGINLEALRARADVDVLFALELGKEGRVTLHLRALDSASWLEGVIADLAIRFTGQIEIRVHGLGD